MPVRSPLQDTASACAVRSGRGVRETTRAARTGANGGERAHRALRSPRRTAPAPQHANDPPLAQLGLALLKAVRQPTRQRAARAMEHAHGHADLIAWHARCRDQSPQRGHGGQSQSLSQPNSQLVCATRRKNTRTRHHGRPPPYIICRLSAVIIFHGRGRPLSLLVLVRLLAAHPALAARAPLGAVRAHLGAYAKKEKTVFWRSEACMLS